MFARVKLLPVTILAALLLLTVKVGEVWQGAGALFGTVVAESAENNGAEGDAAASDGAAGALEDPAAGALEAPLPEGEGVGQIDVANISPAEIELLENLAARRETLDERARGLEMREKLLATAEQRVDARIAELKKLQETIEGMFANLDEQHETQIDSLVKMYEKMKPKDAARIFDRLDLPVLLQVVERMREAKAAPILAKMDVDRAKTVTQELSQRRKLPDDPAAAGQAK